MGRNHLMPGLRVCQCVSAAWAVAALVFALTCRTCNAAEAAPPATAPIAIGILPFAGEAQLARIAEATVAADLRQSPRFAVKAAADMAVAVRNAAGGVAPSNPLELGKLAGAAAVQYVVTGSVTKPQNEADATAFVLDAAVTSDAGKAVPLAVVPRPLATASTVLFGSHQIANYIAAVLTGTSLKLPSLVDDLQRSRADGLSISKEFVVVRENHAAPLPAPQRFGLWLTIDRPGGVYKIGEEVRCTLRAAVDCYCALYTMDPTGDLHPLLPSPDMLPEHLRQQGNVYRSTLRLTAGQDYNVPAAWLGPDFRLQILADQPVGYETIIASASTVPVELPLMRADHTAGPLLASRGLDPGLVFVARTVGIAQGPPGPIRTALAEARFTSIK